MAYSIDKARELVLKAGLELSEAGLVARTWGNISARVSDTQYVITPSGRAYDTLTKEDIVLVNIADGTYEGDIKPSGEKGVHAAVYELCPDVNFVIHTHQNYASALSVLEHSIIPCAEYGMYATEQLVNNIKAQIQAHEGSRAVLMKYHGALCFGKDYDEAFAVAYQLEEVCRKEYEKLCEGSHENIENAFRDKTADTGIHSDNEITSEKNTIEAEVLAQLKNILEQRDGVKSVILVQTPFIMKMCSLGKTMYPYLDDAAQIAGVDVKCVLSDRAQGVEGASTDLAEKIAASIGNGVDISELADALRDRNAVFIKGIGALCTGFDESEAEAVGIVLEKACMAAYLAECVGNVPPLDKESAGLDRDGYVNHYSKLKHS